MPKVVITCNEVSGKFSLERAAKTDTRDDVNDATHVLVEIPQSFFNDYSRIVKREDTHQQKLMAWFTYASNTRSVPRFE